MNLRRNGIVLLCSLFLSACVPYQPFPSEVLEGVDENFDFMEWRMVPNAKTDHKVQLGGRIVEGDANDGGVVIVVAQLPIINHPAYGPKDTGKRSGEFAIFYNGKIDRLALQRGNRLIVVGTTQAAKVVAVNDMQRSLPSITAQCLHIWNTGGREIADFPSYGGGYEPLEENTFCVGSK
ncbi:MAG TPA: Slp family lipoprotein [Nitrospiraceae bacterium]|nr:Slp family lipoprotein [Nitrospiraceae bacterium]